MATIEPYATSSGRRYMVRYRQPNGTQTKKRGFPTKAAAQAFATSVEHDKLSGTYVAPAQGRATVAELAQSWLARQGHAKESWRTRQESLWRVHVAPVWGDRRVSTIERGEVRDWIGQLDRAPSTIGDIHSTLVAILDVAVEDRRIPANPARGVKLPKREHVDHDYLTHDQVHQLAAEVSRHSEIVMLLAYSGLRWGEMAALRPRDCNLDRGRLHITRSASKVNSRSVIGSTKTWEQRTVAVPTQVADMLRPLVAGRDRDALIWTRTDGTPLRPPTTTHWFTKAVHRLADQSPDFPRVTAHELRHTAASLMIASGAHVKTVQRQLGHKTATMTLDLYGHLFDDDLEQIADRMSAEWTRANRAQNVPTLHVV
ncbi:integrase [Gordonia phage Schmidt]|uniref:Integrase n=1 Tax=Gordonia phage Schmidt TaxID=2301697 RepID=A0A385E0F8_9CAUD|nr:integrase [Gordonia phage Schmidt]AXQ65154.1 integrase [Gordonia phage Schmidt]